MRGREHPCYLIAPLSAKLCPTDKLLKLRDVECPALLPVDFFHDIPKNLDFFLFGPDLVSELIDRLALTTGKIPAKLGKRLHSKLLELQILRNELLLHRLNLSQLLLHEPSKFLNLLFTTLLPLR